MFLDGYSSHPHDAVTVALEITAPAKLHSLFTLVPANSPAGDFESSRLLHLSPSLNSTLTQLLLTANSMTTFQSSANLVFADCREDGVLSPSTWPSPKISSLPIGLDLLREWRNDVLGTMASGTEQVAIDMQTEQEAENGISIDPNNKNCMSIFEVDMCQELFATVILPEKQHLIESMWTTIIHNPAIQCKLWLFTGRVQTTLMMARAADSVFIPVHGSPIRIFLYPQSQNSTLDSLYMKPVQLTLSPTATERSGSRVRRLTQLDLSQQNITVLSAATFNHLPSLTTVNLDLNIISVVPAGIFANLTTLASLSINDNALTYLAAGAFVNLPALTSLALAGNQITSLPVGVFQTLPLLSSLDLSSNQITSLPSGLFDELTSLSTLGLSYNAITSIGAYVFRDLSNLQILHVDNNQVASLQSTIFHNLTSLTALNMDNNFITSLGTGLFATLFKLATVTMNNNRITFVGTSTFCNLSHLSSVDLNANAITSVSSTAFLNLPQLTEVFLFDNEMTSFSLAVFDTCPLLSQLALSNNRIANLSLEIPTLVQLSNLNTLDLESNFISEIYGIFSNCCPSLTTIDVSNNQIVDMETTFSGLSTLTQLSLGNNQLSKINASNLAGLTSLGSLKLESNQITSFPSSVHFPLQELDLSFNKLTTFPMHVFSLISQTMYNMGDLDLSGNAIGQIANGTFANASGILEFHLDDNNISHISAASFMGLGNVATFTITNNFITNLPAGVFAFLSQLTTLDLSANQLTYLSGDAFANLTLLTSLTMTGNFLSQLEPGLFAFVSNLQTLDLSGNQITFLSNETFANLPLLSSIYLHSNHITYIAPASFSNLSSLQILLLYQNYLSGVFDLSVFKNNSQLTVLHLSYNKLTGLTIAPNLSAPIVSSLAAFENNNISYISRQVSAHLHSISSFTFQNNPSSCRKVVISAQVHDVVCVCDCLGEYYGSDFCEPSLGFISPPLFISQKNYDPTSCQDQDGVYGVLSVCSVFSLPFQQSEIYLGSALFSTVDITQPISLDPLAPSSVTYAATDTNLATVGLTLLTKSFGEAFSIVGTPTQSGLYHTSVVGTDAVTKESLNVSFMVINVTDCGPNTCLNNGTCIDDSSIYNMLYSCACQSNYTGTRCETALFTQSAAAQSASTNATTIISAVVPSFAALILIGVGILILAKVRAARQRERLRKNYHVFISYRVATDSDIANTLCTELQKCHVPWKDGTQVPLKCFFDKQDIGNGSKWRETFSSALEHSCLYVPIISEAALAPMKALEDPKLVSNPKPDNLLYEFELAAELAQERRLIVFPVLLGSRSHVLATDGSRSPASIAVTCHEDNSNKFDSTLFTRFNFEEFGAHKFPPCPTYDNPRGSVSATIASMLSFQGVFLHVATRNHLWTKATASASTAQLLSEIVHDTLINMAWYNPSNSNCIRGMEHWQLADSKSAAEQSSGSRVEPSTLTESGSKLLQAGPHGLSNMTAMDGNGALDKSESKSIDFLAADTVSYYDFQMDETVEQKHKKGVKEYVY